MKTMPPNLLLQYPATYYLRPERKEHLPRALDKTMRLLAGGFLHTLRLRKGLWNSIVSRVDSYGATFEKMSEKELREAATQLRARLHEEGFRDKLVANVFALVREIAGRTLGMRHYDCQLIGGWALLQGNVIEMETGEGKTVAATLAAGTAALAGVPVHVITVNDYLASRDAEWMGVIYKALGLTVGCVTHGSDPVARRAAYQCDITYCTNKEIVFDYLRDKIILGNRVNPLSLQTEYLYGEEARVKRLMLRGLHFAIIDEADSILIDEARTPLIISNMVGSKDSNCLMEQAMTVANNLKNGVDYNIQTDLRKIELTEIGKLHICELTEPFDLPWKSAIRREEVVRQALIALHLFRRDEHYLVRDGKVQIIDEFTGRVMPDRSWEQGLHQLIEIKEGCRVTQQRETLMRISYQRFFRRYLQLAGMTGTALEVKKELESVYGLSVVRIPTNRALKRICCPDRIFPTLEDKWQAVVDRVKQLHSKGRPVLIGTRSVVASEHLSRLFSESGLAHQVLNAKQDKEEANIIARAGEPRCITIATNMAGRGTDIKLASGVAQRRGLHVILTERHEAARIDRQLAGRCGRQGDPGSYEALLSIKDPLLEGSKLGLFSRVALRFLRPTSFIWTLIGRFTILKAQKKVERIHAQMRKKLFKQDLQRGELLSFSGRSE